MKISIAYGAGIAGILILGVLLCKPAATLSWRAPILLMPDIAAYHVPGEELLGGGTTVRDTGSTAYGRSAYNLIREHWPEFFKGKISFVNQWDDMPQGVASPLGPLFNARSCDGCHDHDGRGQPPASPDEVSESMVVHLSVVDGDGPARPDPVYGSQLDLHGVHGGGWGHGEGIVQVEYDELRGVYADGGSYALTRPEYRFRRLAYGPLHRDIRFSPRVAPFNFGLGLLEMIPESDILAHADPDDRDHDGISGRPNQILEIKSGSMMLGRFGWKANQPTLEQQVARAFHADLGITTSLYPEDVTPPEYVLGEGGNTPELDEKVFSQVVAYVRFLGVPRQREWEKPLVQHGRALFSRIGCTGCHISRFRTGINPAFPELSDQLIHPYTDLLLHDMGDDLADDRPDGLATGREWRTPPLWGIGLVEKVGGHTRFLHDGRARNLEEAILWHGGEGAASQELYRRLRKQDRMALLAFLESL